MGSKSNHHQGSGQPYCDNPPKILSNSEYHMLLF